MRTTQSGAVVERRGAKGRVRPKPRPKPKCGFEDPRNPGVRCEAKPGHSGRHQARTWRSFGDRPELAKGRILRYVASDPDGGYEGAVEEWPAHVLRVHSDTCATLLVMDLDGARVVRDVPYSAMPTVGTWHWPSI